MFNVLTIYTAYFPFQITARPIPDIPPFRPDHITLNKSVSMSVSRSPVQTVADICPRRPRGHASDGAAASAVPRVAVAVSPRSLQPAPCRAGPGTPPAQVGGRVRAHNVYYYYYCYCYYYFYYYYYYKHFSGTGGSFACTYITIKRTLNNKKV